MKDLDIQVGDRVTFHYTDDDEVNIWLVSYKDEADDFISDNDRKILKIERIGEKRLVYSLWERERRAIVNRWRKRVFEKYNKIL